MLHVHFVTSYMMENKNGKQTLESAQYELEINGKQSDFFRMAQKPRKGGFRELRSKSFPEGGC